MKKFRIIIESDYELDETMLWPEGDSPENPTEEDVTALIEKCGGGVKIINDWNLPPEIIVTEVKLRNGEK